MHPFLALRTGAPVNSGYYSNPRSRRADRRRAAEAAIRQARRHLQADAGIVCRRCALGLRLPTGSRTRCRSAAVKGFELHPSFTTPVLYRLQGSEPARPEARPPQSVAHDPPSPLLTVVPVLFGVSVIVFLVISLVPGDPAQAILGTFATPENVAAAATRSSAWTGSLPVQYADLARQSAARRFRPLLHPAQAGAGRDHGPAVPDAAAGRRRAACCPACSAFCSASSPRCARTAGQDKLITVTVLVGISTPSFWLGILLIFWFARAARAGCRSAA